MLSTHFDMPHRPEEGELQLTDLPARQAADYLERKRAEEALRTLATELRQTTHTLATGLIHCSRDLRYVWANPAYAELAGVSLDHIVGRPIVEVMGQKAFETIRPTSIGCSTASGSNMQPNFLGVPMAQAEGIASVVI